MKENTTWHRRHFLQNVGVLAATTFLPAGILSADQNNFPVDLKPVLIKLGEGDQFFNPSSSFTQKLTAAHTNRAFSCTETVVNDGWLVGPPPLHHHLDEIMYVLEGNVTVLICEEVVEVSAGSWHFRPRDIIHTFWNKSGGPAKIIDIYLPGGFEEYLKKLCEVYQKYGKIETAEVEKFVKTYDIELHFELLGPLIGKYGLKF